MHLITQTYFSSCLKVYQDYNLLLMLKIKLADSLHSHYDYGSSVWGEKSSLCDILFLYSTTYCLSPSITHTSHTSTTTTSTTKPCLRSVEYSREDGAVEVVLHTTVDYLPVSVWEETCPWGNVIRNCACTVKPQTKPFWLHTHS